VEEALAQGTDVVFRLDIQGAHTIRRTFPDAVSIFLVGLHA
jgi:guanylate kinase